MGRERQILELLNTDQFHSGEGLAEQLGISRAAVWKVIQNLTAHGVDIHAVRGRGYRLAYPLEFLDRTSIESQLDAAVQTIIAEIQIHEHIDSTNTYLMGRAKCGQTSASVCLAELQSAGRGRRGRSWVSPYGANLYLSLLWRFSAGPALLSGLSLATGIAVARALEGLGVTEIGLKWPNDLLWQGRKLGGMLLEFGGESSGPCYVVAGIGLNVAMPQGAQERIDQPWVDLRTILGSVSRNRLAAQVLNQLVLIFSHFEETGLGSIVQEWTRYDQVAGQSILLKLPHKTITGVACSVDETGALLVKTDSGVERFMAGEISLRLDS